MSYTPRTSVPSTGDLRWTRASYGGYNQADFPPKIVAWGGSVLANCTGYVHGRWMEIGNTNTDYNLSTGNANEYYNHADGYERGSEPKLGAILCLGGGANGHVAIVEEILSDGNIMCSESNYDGPIFRYVQRDRATGWKMHGGSTVGGFQGFIYHPNISPTPSTHTLTVINGSGSTTGTSGTTVNISASKGQGQIFQGWSLSGSGSIANTKYLNTTFTFGDGDATATANFKDKGKSKWVIYTPYLHVKPKL